jgi:hypothetical protein
VQIFRITSFFVASKIILSVSLPVNSVIYKKEEGKKGWPREENCLSLWASVK